MAFGRDAGERPRGEEFLEWLADAERQEATGGLGAFARWVVLAVEDGDVRPGETWYPKRMERGSSQFSLEDWKEARAMYNEREMRYCCGNGNDDCDAEGLGCWRSGACTGVCSSGPPAKLTVTADRGTE